MRAACLGNGRNLQLITSSSWSAVSTTVVRLFFSYLRACPMPDAPSVELNLYVSRLSPEQIAQEEVAHALLVQRAVSSGNYRAFFRLYLSAPKMSGYIMDHIRDRERVKALIIMTRS
jgi:hypothetical protein